MSRPKKIAVVAHAKKSLGGGLDELRRRLADDGVDTMHWYEVSKSRKAPKQIRKALAAGVDLIVVWGGDGMVQRSVDAVASAAKGSRTPVAIVPAGTANLLATNLGIPQDLAEAVRIAFHGTRRRLDLGRLGGEHFAVMAGVGFDGAMIRDADRDLKDRLGKLAYVWTGLRQVDGEAPRARVRIDDSEWFDGDASCVLVGNVGTITGGIEAFDDARPDDGWLDVGVATAQGAAQWARTLGRMAVGRSDDSPFVRMTRARKIDIKLHAPMVYELDGGAREPVQRLKVRVIPGAVTICVPDRAAHEAAATTDETADEPAHVG